MVIMQAQQAGGSLKAGALLYVSLNPECTVYYLVQNIYSIKIYWAVSFMKMDFLGDIYPHIGTLLQITLKMDMGS